MRRLLIVALISCASCRQEPATQTGEIVPHLHAAYIWDEWHIFNSTGSPVLYETWSFGRCDSTILLPGSSSVTAPDSFKILRAASWQEADSAEAAWVADSISMFAGLRP
jgi:hypothetical protein